MRKSILLTLLFGGFVSLYFLVQKFETYQAKQFKSFIDAGSRDTDSVTSSNTITRSKSVHIIGAFGISSPERVRLAKLSGINTGFYYGSVPAKSVLQSSLMSEGLFKIDATLWNILYDYECYRTWNVLPDPSPDYCTEEKARNAIYTSPEKVLSQVDAYLSRDDIINDNLITHFWLLDDWPATRYIKGKGIVNWDPGHAKQLLIEISNRVDENNAKNGLNRKTICGFAAHFGYSGGRKDNWFSQLALNFDPKACDVAAIYSYSLINQKIEDPSQYSWQLDGLLEKVISDLRDNGFTHEEHPIIGIVQAYGKPSHRVIPRAVDIVTESKAFCEKGADGIAYFTYDISSVSDTTNATNSEEIRDGITQGVQLCKAIWSSREE